MVETLIWITAMFGALVAFFSVFYQFICVMVAFCGGEVLSLSNDMRIVRPLYEKMKESMVFHSSSFYHEYGVNYPMGVVVMRIDGAWIVGNLTVAMNATHWISTLKLNGNLIAFKKGFRLAKYDTVSTPILKWAPGNEQMARFECTHVISPRPWQKAMAQSIVDRLASLSKARLSQSVAILLCGSPDIGKSTFALYLAQVLSFHLEIFGPKTFAKVASGMTMKSTVMLLNEVDDIMMQTMTAATSADDDTPTDNQSSSGTRHLTSKTEWNDTLDLLQYANQCVVIMTTNKSSRECLAMLKTPECDNTTMLRPSRIISIDVDVTTANKIAWCN